MNLEVFFLFLNAFLSMLLGAVIIFGILRREYRPTLLRLETEARQAEEKPGSQ